MAIRPAKKMATDITPAKIGRSMKNLDNILGVCCFDCPARAAGLAV
jgi:hypothetical protein